MPFVKLDCGILNSTIWFDRDAREMFITALLMATPIQLTEAAPQLHVRSLKETGWQVPPGWYGFVAAAGVGIIYRAGLQEELGLNALERLGNPERESRSHDYEGRRLVRIDGGYLVLNYMRYREHDYGAAERMRQYRKRQKEARLAGKQPLRRNPPPLRRTVTGERNIVTEAEAEAEAEKEKEKDSPLRGREHAATWVHALGRLWEAAYQGKPAYGQIGKHLKSLITKHGTETVKLRWANYLRATDAQYASPARFAQTFGKWTDNGKPRGPQYQTPDEADRKAGIP